MKVDQLYVINCHRQLVHHPGSNLVEHFGTDGMNDSARYKQTVWIYKCNDIGNGDRDAIDNFSYKLRNLGSPVLMPSANSSSVHLMETLSPRWKPMSLSIRICRNGMDRHLLHRSLYNARIHLQQSLIPL